MAYAKDAKQIKKGGKKNYIVLIIIITKNLIQRVNVGDVNKI